MINFSSALLGKDLTELTYQDIVDFFKEEREESESIEFKGFVTERGSTFDKNINGVIRAICAFLNSTGGIVIWGAPIGKTDDKGIKKCVGALSPVNEYKEKDRIISCVSGKITPLPVGIRVQILQKSATENLYIFEVQPSNYKPHQSEDRYWVRLDGQTKAAPHYLIEALFKQIRYPNIEGYIKFNSAMILGGTRNYEIIFTLFLFNFSELQNEENVSYHIFTHPGVFKSNTGKMKEVSGKVDMLHYGTPSAIHDRIIITPEVASKCKHQMVILLTIAGKTSPAKVCEYRIDLQKVNLENPMDTSELIESMTENQLMSERKQQQGFTKDQTLEALLDRKPKQ